MSTPGSRLPAGQDEFLVSDEGALHAALAGRTLTIRTRQHTGPPGGEDTIDGEFRVTVVRVKRAVVGLDAGGLFSGVVLKVKDRDYAPLCPVWTFYADGQVCDADEREVGRCDLTAVSEADKGMRPNWGHTRPGAVARQMGTGPCDESQSGDAPGLSSPVSLTAAPEMTDAERHAHPLLAGLLDADRMLRGGT